MRQKTIMVVDDELGVVKTLDEFLTESGYAVVGSTSGEEALSLLREKTVDLVLLDLRMPGLKGAEVARIIRQRDPQIKILIVTAYPQDTQSLLDGKIVEGVLTKPIGLEELRASIENLLNR